MIETAVESKIYASGAALNLLSSSCGKTAAHAARCPPAEIRLPRDADRPPRIGSVSAYPPNEVANIRHGVQRRAVFPVGQPVFACYGHHPQSSKPFCIVIHPLRTTGISPSSMKQYDRRSGSRITTRDGLKHVRRKLRARHSLVDFDFRIRHPHLRIRPYIFSHSCFVCA
jgi:hypothetical protein